jgi:hypothetical protein
MELGDLLLGLTQRRGSGERLGHAFSRHTSGQTELRIVTGIVQFGAMAGRFTAAAHYSSDGTGPQVAQSKEFIEKFGAVGFEDIQSFGHGFLSERFTLRPVPQKKESAQYRTSVAHPH